MARPFGKTDIQVEVMGLRGVVSEGLYLNPQDLAMMI